MLFQLCHGKTLSEEAFLEPSLALTHLGPAAQFSSLLIPLEDFVNRSAAQPLCEASIQSTQRCRRCKLLQLEALGQATPPFHILQPKPSEGRGKTEKPN